MKILVISKNSQLYSSARLLAEAQSLGLESKHQDIYQSSHWTENERSSSTVVFNRYSGILFDDYDLQLCQSWKNKGSLILNPIEELQIFRDKLSSHIFLNNLELSCIPTRAIRGALSREEIEEVIDFNDIPGQCPNEYIIKPTRSNKGLGMSLCRGIDSLYTQLESYYHFGDQRFIIQPRMRGIREYRLFFIEDQIIGAFEKHAKRQDEFRLNAQRSECFAIEPENLSEELISFFQTIRRNTHLFYGGIDILETENQFFILEVNPCPGFETLEEVCRVNVAKELISRVHQSMVN
ncbi:hypothetical protein BIY24_09985 [Halobacteriovorax marinus]|uniref:ATP-grasp domain-containing protein n=1 Tax=Halobacteriovorax marinus TaxID=97084 RepID=UPI000BC30F72|nr:hypothetical protein [Halobacteriovorax marinus]ATH08266.1 hypothetical protein BIY24_09985 [Halobacteriovorax marinus]